MDEQILYAIKTRRLKVKPGPGPKREATFNETSRKWDLTISPPAWSKFKPTKISLTSDQYQRYQSWREGDILIQDALPELSFAEREVLISGISPKDWTEAFGEDDEE